MGIYLSSAVVILSLFAMLEFVYLGANLIFYALFVVVFVLMLYLLYITNIQPQSKEEQKSKSSKSRERRYIPKKKIAKQ
ncbi:MAG: hypothetical protein ACP5RI_01025 [Candidatus Micrarchaeia archaeon]